MSLKKTIDSRHLMLSNYICNPRDFKSVAILGWTELAKYRILQEEQKTNTYFEPFTITLKLD